jgi:hypothetical protein
MLAGATLALTTRTRHRGDADGVIVHGARNRGKVGRVGAGAATGATRGTVLGHLAHAQGHQGSGIDNVRGHIGMTGGAGRVRGTAVGVLGHGSSKVQGGEAQARQS